MSEHCQFLIDVWHKADGSYLTQVALHEPSTTTGDVDESLAHMTVQLMVLVAKSSDLGLEGTLAQLVEEARHIITLYHIGEPHDGLRN